MKKRSTILMLCTSVREERSSEAGGVQGAAQNLGQSLGTALIGAVLLTGLTNGFHDRVNADPAVPANVRQQVVKGTEGGLQMVSEQTFRTTAQNVGIPPDQVGTLVGHYQDAQIQALKRALLVASMFALVALWFARALPGEALSSPGRVAPRAEPAVVT